MSAKMPRRNVLADLKREIANGPEGMARTAFLDGLKEDTARSPIYTGLTRKQREYLIKIATEAYESGYSSGWDNRKSYEDCD